MVLSILRKKARSFFVYVAFGIIIIVFIFYFGWGRGMRDKSNSETWAAKVNDVSISQQRYLSYYKQMENYYRELYKQQLDSAMLEKLGLKQKALDALIDEALMLQAAQAAGIKVSQAEMQEKIQNMKAFQTNGRFDLERYRQLLHANQLSPQEFEENQVRGIMVDRIQSVIEGAAKISDEELWEQYRNENEKVKLEYVVIDSAQAAPATEPAEAEEQDYFEKNKEQFRVPDTIKLEYVAFTAKEFARQVTVTDEEIQQYYTDFSDEFWEPERVHARHILIRVAQNAEPEEKQKARQKAEDLRTQLEKGASFAALAEKYSEDQASAKQGGDLGFFSRGQMVTAFEEAAFSLKPGAISEIVESPFGYHIIMVEEKKPEGVKLLEDVKETIRTTITESHTAELCKREAFRTYRSSLKDKNLRAYAEANGLKVEESGVFSREQSLPIFLESSEALEEAFRVSSGEMVYPFSAQGTFYVSKVTARHESHLPGLAEVKDEVRAILKKQRSEQAANDKAKALLAAARDIGDLGVAAKNENLTTKTTRFFTRVGRSIPDLGPVPDLMMTAFSLDANHPFPDTVFPVEGKVYVVKWAGKDEVRKEDFERKKKDLSERYLRLKQSEYTTAWLKLARNKARIEINPKLVR